MVGVKSEEARNKWWASMIKRYGSEEAVRESMRIHGAKGGEAPTTRPKGFAANPELAVLAGKKSKRGKREKSAS